jgi:hypothetical protein
MPIRHRGEVDPPPVDEALAGIHPKPTLILTTVALGLDRLKRAIQDGKTSDGETLGIARLEDLSDQVMQQATPTATKFQVRFTAVPTQNFAPVFVVPGSLVAFVDSNPAPVTPSEDVNTSGVFALAVAPVEQLQVTYAWAYFQDKSLEGFLDEARAWVAGPVTFANLGEVPDGLVPAVIGNAAARALRALAAKCALATARAGDSEMSFSDLAKAYTLQANEQQKNAEAVRKSYYSRADQPLAPAAEASALSVGVPYQPRR